MSLLYRVESWLFMSPLKCSNFFSVSSLKEPPEGWASGRQEFGKPDAQVTGSLGHHPPRAATSV